MIDVEGKRILVVGLGTSGEASARVLSGLGASPVVVDSSETPLCVDEAGALTSIGVEVRLGVDVPDDLSTFGLAVASPGVPDSAPVLSAARAAGLRVISELELGYRLLEPTEFIAVTGTNGKTTTTQLLGDMLDRPGRRAFTCGNIGAPVTGLYGHVREGDLLVCEVSSFQLQNIEEFHARVAVVLNIAPDHFDWHRDMEEYGRAKARIVENMEESDHLVFNADDEFCRDLAANAKAVGLGFGHEKRAGAALWVEGGWIVTGPPLAAGKLLDTGELKLAGGHNVDNVMAAAAAALAIGEDASSVREAALSFLGLEHRCEPVGEVGGVTFYNDSKATNPHATMHAVKSFHGDFVAILGGRNKGLDFTELAEALCGRMSDGSLLGVVLVGESAPEIGEAISTACASDSSGKLETVGDLQEAVRRAYKTATPGASVLFSPACASFDMFSDYKDRGKAFKRAVGRLAGGGPGGGLT